MRINPHVFRKHGIRGRVGADLTPGFFREVGVVLGREAGVDKMVVGMDTRSSSPEFLDGLVNGLLAVGVDVVDVGMVPRGAAVFAGWRRRLAVCYITASHLPAEWNGLKVLSPEGIAYESAFFSRLREGMLQGGGKGQKEGRKGRRERFDVLGDYIDYLKGKLPRSGGMLQVVVDCGNATACVAAPRLFEELGFLVDVLFGEVLPDFPNRESEIGQEVLGELARRVKKEKSLGVAYDGDADRMTLAAPQAGVLDAEQVAWVIGAGVFSSHAGDIVANAACGVLMERLAARYGRELIRVPVGTRYMLTALREHRAAMGVESSMHFCLPHILPFDDGIAVSAFAAWCAEHLKEEGEDLDSFLAALPVRHRLKKAFEVDDGEKFSLVDGIRERCGKLYGRVDTTDGVRIDTGDGWVLVRASDTSPLIRITVEASSPERARELMESFAALLSQGA